MTRRATSYADHDHTTSEGQRALMELLAKDATTFWEAFEPMRHTPSAQRAGIDMAVARATYTRTALLFRRGVATLKSGIAEFGPVGDLIFAACALMENEQLEEIFNNLDEVRRRASRRHSGKQDV